MDMGIDSSKKESNLPLDMEELELICFGNDGDDDDDNNDDDDNDEADNMLESLKKTWIIDFDNTDSQVTASEPINNSFMYFDCPNRYSTWR
jgi:hypothetical protein